MNKLPLKKEICKFVKSEYPQWVHSGRIAKLSEELMYKGSNGERRARELSNEGIFERKIQDRCVHYRYVFPAPINPEKESEEHLIASLL